MKDKDEPKKTQYAVVTFDGGPGEDAISYWSLYDSIEDAVTEAGDGVEVFRAEFKSIGTYVRSVSVVKTKKRKGK